MIVWKVFIASFIIGLLCVYFTSAASKLTIIYPSLQNKVTYQDTSGACFHMVPKEVTCTSSVFTPPIQFAEF